MSFKEHLKSIEFFEEPVDDPTRDFATWYVVRFVCRTTHYDRIREFIEEWVDASADAENSEVNYKYIFHGKYCISCRFKSEDDALMLRMFVL